MVYAYLKLAQDKNARAVVDEMAGSSASDLPGASFALAASPARYMVERGDWGGAAELQVRPSKYPHVTAITHFARALGAARAGKPDAAKIEAAKIDAAKSDIAKLAELRDKLREAKDGLLGRAGEHPVAGRKCLAAAGGRQSDDALRP